MIRDTSAPLSHWVRSEGMSWMGTVGTCAMSSRKPAHVQCLPDTITGALGSVGMKRLYPGSLGDISVVPAPTPSSDLVPLGEWGRGVRLCHGTSVAGHSHNPGQNCSRGRLGTASCSLDRHRPPECILLVFSRAQRNEELSCRMGIIWLIKRNLQLL